MSAPSPSSHSDVVDAIGISVVIPAYGRPEGLLRAIESVRASVLRQLEIVVVDDASPIALESAVPARNSHGVPVRYYRLSRNGGPQSARNLGIRRARYPYVAFLDSDDIFFPEKIDVIRTHLSDGQCDLLFHAVEGLPTYARIGRIWNKRLRRLLAFDWLVVFLNPVVTPSLVVRRAVLLGVPGMRHAEDWAFLLRIAQPKMSVIYLDMALSKVYRALGSEGGQSSARWAMRKGEFRARALLLRKMRPANYLKFAAGTAAGCVRIAWDLARMRYRRGTGST